MNSLIHGNNIIMANILRPSVSSLNNTDFSPKGESKLLTPAGSSFAAALAQVKGKSTASISNPLHLVGNNASQNPSLPASIAPSLPNVPPHFPLRTLQNETGEDSLHERALGLRAYRQQLLASNIANADTPGYKARDIDIQEAIRTGKTPESVEIKYTVPSQGNIDRNTVEMDSERVKFTENAIMYEYEIDRVKGHYKDMDDLLKGTPY